MSTENLPCRRCNTVSADPVVIYGRDEAGALVPRAAQCRDECPRAARAGHDRNRAQRSRTRGREEVVV